MRFTSLVVMLTALVATPAAADVAVTVYNQDLGLIRETRELDFPKGSGEIRFVDVASRIIPTSVHFTSDKGALLEQNYEYDLVDVPKLMSKYLDSRVILKTRDGETYTGMLLSAQGGVVLQRDDGAVTSLATDWVAGVDFPELPEGLITRPTLVWLVESKKGGRGRADISYLTHGMSWEAEYVAVASVDDKQLSLTGWVNITNKSGATYPDARIKLIAGDVRVEPRKWGYGRNMVAMKEATAAPQFKEQAFYEYHLYTLQRPSTLKQSQVKQISLFPTAEVRRVEKEYRYDWWENRRNGEEANKVRVTLIFKNSKENGLGMALPKGKMRVYKTGPDGGQEFIGEDRIDHTPRNETLHITTGNAFDVVGERTETDVKRGGAERTIKFKVRNHKDETVEVVVAEHIGGDWTILEATPGWTKVSSGEINWRVTLKPEEEQTLGYRVYIRGF